MIDILLSWIRLAYFFGDAASVSLDKRFRILYIEYRHEIR